MNKTGLAKGKDSQTKRQKKYYVCQRCGYVTIIRNSNCPICAKEGKEIQMK